MNYKTKLTMRLKSLKIILFFSALSAFGQGNSEDKIDLMMTQKIGGILFSPIHGGTFLMGSDKTNIEYPIHKVTITGFQMATTEITQKVYQEIMGINPSSPIGEMLPVNNVSWEEAVEFTKRFSKKYKVKVRLPTEAEWEFAAREGLQIDNYWENVRENASKYANFADKNAKRTEWHDIKPPMDLDDGYSEISPVGKFLPNKFGLFDMLGNVMEWCLDLGEDYQKADQIDPLPKKTRYNGGSRVLRGGSYESLIEGLRVSDRIPNTLETPLYKFPYIGFRIVISPVHNDEKW